MSVFAWTIWDVVDVAVIVLIIGAFTAVVLYDKIKGKK